MFLKSCRQGIGFSPEIETPLRLPRFGGDRRRQGIGFSPEIETYLGLLEVRSIVQSPGDWLLA